MVPMKTFKKIGSNRLVIIVAQVSKSVELRDKVAFECIVNQKRGINSPIHNEIRCNTIPFFSVKMGGNNRPIIVNIYSG